VLIFQVALAMLKLEIPYELWNADLFPRQFHSVLLK